MKPLSKGDPCRVRIHTGEVVEAVYDEPCRTRNKEHWVETKEFGYVLAVANPSDPEVHVRFVGNPCVLVPVEVSV